MDFSQIKQLQKTDNELILKVLEKPLLAVYQTISNSPVPKTLEAICMLQVSINFLKTGIFKLALDDNNYGMAVLERSLYEHVVKHFYLFFKYCKCKNDSAGVEYYKWTDIKEYIDFFTSLKKKHELNGTENKEYDIDSLISDIYSGYAELPKKERRNNLANYSFFQLLKSVTADLKNKNEAFTDLPSTYSILSSFVHGGPHANRAQMFNSSFEEEREKTLYRGCKKAYLYTVMSLTNTFVVAGQYNKGLLKYVEIIKSYISKVPDE